MCSGGVASQNQLALLGSSSSTHSSIDLEESICSQRLGGPSDTTNELDQPSLEDNQNTINKLDSHFSKEDQLIKDEELAKEEESELKKKKESVEDVSVIPPGPCWFAGLLDKDLSTIDPLRAKFLENLKALKLSPLYAINLSVEVERGEGRVDRIRAKLLDKIRELVDQGKIDFLTAIDLRDAVDLLEMVADDFEDASDIIRIIAYKHAAIPLS